MASKPLKCRTATPWSLRLKAVDALFIAHMAEGDAVMLPMKGYEDGQIQPHRHRPLQFVKWVRGDRVEMARFDGYWNPFLPYLDRVTFRFISDPAAQIAALKAGDIDVIGYIAAPESAMMLEKGQTFQGLRRHHHRRSDHVHQQQGRPFDNLLVRRAMAHAIDRQAVVDLVMFGYGTPIGSHWSPSTPTIKISPADFPTTRKRPKPCSPKPAIRTALRPPSSCRPSTPTPSGPVK
jgi:peptide/nickel transport system substrate-binding protein